MSNFKWGLTAAIAAFVISAGLGFFSGVGVFFIFLRAFIFSVVFFGLGFAMRLIANSFFPELLSDNNGREHSDTFDQPPSRIDITLDNAGEYAVPELYKTSRELQKLDNIEDLLTGHFRARPELPAKLSAAGIDRNKEEGYNDTGGIQDASDQDIFKFQEEAVFEKVKERKPVFTPSFGDDSSGLGGLPDLDAMAMAFTSGGEPHAADTAPFGFGGSSSFSGAAVPNDVMEQVKSKYVGNKPQPLPGDFNPKELAEGLRTVLSKDK